MFELLAPATCVFLGMLGLVLAGKGSLLPTDNPSDPTHPYPAEVTLLMFGWLCLIGCGLGLLVFEQSTDIADVQQLPMFNQTTFVSIGVGLIVLGIIFTAIGNLSGNVLSQVAELGGTFLFVFGIGLIGNATINPQWHANLRDSIFPPVVAKTSEKTGPLTAEVKSGDAKATATIETTPEKKPDLAPPVAAKTPDPPASKAADVTGVKWTKKDRKQVIFPKLADPNRRWAIKHGPAGKTVSDFVPESGVYASTTDLENVRAYEVDLSDPADPKPLSLGTPVPLVD